MSKISSWLKPLASASIFYYATIWLAVLVTVGTVSQKFFGLQDSLARYFSAWFVHVNLGDFFDHSANIPFVLPAGRFIMTVIMINLSVKLLIASKWKFKMLGINITHLGVFILMAGGVITAYTTTEGYITVPEGGSSAIFRDFHEVELAVTDRTPKDHDAVTAFTQNFFSEGQTFSDPAVPFTFKVLSFFPNCKPVSRTNQKENPNAPLRDKAKNFQFEPLPNDPDDMNASGLEVEISGASDESNGTYVFFNDPRKGNTSAFIKGKDGNIYQVTLRPRNYELPFTLKLIQFEKTNHAGTMMARSFKSKVEISQDGRTEKIDIYMNHPLRRNGYSVYQSGFGGGNGMGPKTSTFQVVTNKGQMIPYIAIIIITLGLLIHVIIQVPRLLASKK